MQGCNGPFDFSPPKINDWDGGETYAKSMINGFQQLALYRVDGLEVLMRRKRAGRTRPEFVRAIHDRHRRRRGETRVMESYYNIGQLPNSSDPARAIISNKKKKNSSTTDKL